MGIIGHFIAIVGNEVKYHFLTGEYQEVGVFYFSIWREQSM